MPSEYLREQDYADYGLGADTTRGQVRSASILIDAYLKRKEGLVWLPDAAGNPGWMEALVPAITLNAGAAIAPGLSVQVPVTGGIAGLSVGEALILDRLNPEIAEVVVVVSTTGSVITLQSVAFEHPGPCTLDLGCTIKQHKFMPQGRPITNLAYTPVTRLLSGQGRYGYGRRGDASRYQVDDYNLLASLSHFGGPPAWEFFPLENTGIDPQSGQLWVPAGVMLAYYSEVNIWYVAGYAQANLPDAIRMACAQIMQAQINLPQMGNTKSYKAGDTAIEAFASSILSDDSKALLAPYRAKLFN